MTMTMTIFNEVGMVMVVVNSHSPTDLSKQVYINNLPDNKRQQTTTVDNKRLINGLILAEFAILRREN